MKKWILVIALAVPLIFLACQKKKETYADDYDQAQVLMEEGKYNSVITLLEPSLIKNPKHQPTRLLLASAYAARSGIFITNFSSLARGFLDTPVPSYNSEKDVALISALQQTQALIEKFKSIPEIKTDSQWMDIERAILIIEQDSNFSGGAAVYSGLLRLVSFRYELTQQENLFGLRSCQITPKFLSAKLNFIYTKTSGILNAFLKATPKPEEKQIFQSHLNNLQSNYNLLTTWVSQAETLDEFKITQIFQKCDP